jgi:hypothetical protein
VMPPFCSNSPMDVAIVPRHREHVVLDGDVVVLQLLGFVFGTTDDFEGAPDQGRLRAPGHARQARDLRATAARSAVTSAPAFWRSGPATPPSCSSIAESRCSG